MLKLKLQSFGHLIRRANSLEKIKSFLILGKTEGRKEAGDIENEMVRWHHTTQWT